MKKMSTPFNALSVYLLFAMLPLQAQAKETFELMTLSNSGAVCQSCGLYNSEYPAVSANGRFVVFQSTAGDLVTPNANGYVNIYLRDRQNATTELISTSDGTNAGNGTSEKADVSDDGCYVVFSSYASNLVAGDTNGVEDVFLRNRCSQPRTTTRVSWLASGAQTSWGNNSANITPDGHYISYANGNEGVVRYNVQTGATQVLTGTLKAGSQSSISDDGKRVAFYSYNPVINSDSNGVWDIYLWDETAGLSLISTSKAGGQRNQGNESTSRVTQPAISGDGRYVSFTTTSDNLVAPDAGSFQDVFVKDTQSGDLDMSSVTSAGVQGNDDSPSEQGGRAVLSQTGYWVVYETKAKNLTGNAPSNATVLHNRMTGQTIALDNTARFGHGNRPAISGDKYGRFTAFYSSSKLDTQAGHDSAGVFLYDRHKLPVAVAGIDTSTTLPITLGGVVKLDGSASNNNLNATYFLPDAAPGLVYTWTQTDGPAVTFSDPHAVKPSFSVPAEGSYKFKLVVSDTVEDSTPATVTVQVGAGSVTPNQKPIANAGSDQAVATGDIVDLNGSLSSDPDSGPDALSYSWTQISGQSLTLSNANTATPSFTPVLGGSYSFRLVVSDGQDLSVPDVVTINVGDGSTANVPPVAVAGEDQSALVNETVYLDGSQSFDADGDILSVKWTQVGGVKVTLIDPESTYPSFVAKKVGSYSFKLVVNDGQEDSLASIVTVTVASGSSSGNELPVAVADAPLGSQIVGTAIKLSGVRSYDPDMTGKKLKYQWVQSDGPALVKLASSTSATPKFTPNQPGDYVFDLVVFDGLDWGVPESVTVHVGGEIQVTSPYEGEIWSLNSRPIIQYQTSGINPKVSMTAYLVWLDANGEFKVGKLPGKPKAKAYGSLSVRIPNNPAYLFDSAWIVLCEGVNKSDFCGASQMFSIQ